MDIRRTFTITYELLSKKENIFKGYFYTFIGFFDFFGGKIFENMHLYFLSAT